MKCKNCNIELSNNNSFCPSCGKTIFELQNLDLLEQNKAININQDIVAQNFNANVQPNTTIETLNNNVEPIISAQTLSNNQSTTTGETLNNSIDQPMTYQSFNDIQTAPPAQNLNIPLEPEVPYQESNNNIKTQNSYQPSYNKDEPKKKCILFLNIMVIFLIALLGIGGALFSKTLVKTTPRQIFNTVINSVFLNTTTLLDKNNDIINGTFSLKSNITGDNIDNTKLEIFKILNNIFISAEYGIDYKNKVALVSFNSTYEDAELLKANVYFKNNKGYVLLNNIYDKYLSSDIENYNDMFTRSEYSDDHKIVIEEMQKSLTISLKDEYFIKEETDGITKSILFLNNNNSVALIKDIFTYLDNSTKFKTSLSNVLNTEEKEINNYIREVLVEFNEPSNSSNIIKIAIYTDNKTKEFKKFEIIIEETNSEEMVIITKNNINNYNYQYYLNAKEVYSGNVTIKTEGENTNIQYSMTMEGYTVGLNINYSLKYNEVIKELDVSNSVDYAALTDEDFNNIYNKLINNAGFNKIFSIYKDLTSQVIQTNDICFQAYNCQEGLSDMLDCNYIDNDGIETTIQCSSEDYVSTNNN
ncbi:MAG: zinc ribbon domain-containing protein [Bacilli bacterium]|nr:zinc ribbon domain-containing protein [Bacilli bacterium]MDD4406761.1 zinc ribbon domain-containing protein [Bacilli bacterium]